jgi:hypothetical protein
MWLKHSNTSSRLSDGGESIDSVSIIARNQRLIQHRNSAQSPGLKLNRSNSIRYIKELQSLFFRKFLLCDLCSKYNDLKFGLLSLTKSFLLFLPSTMNHLSAIYKTGRIQGRENKPNNTTLQPQKLKRKHIILDEL